MFDVSVLPFLLSMNSSTSSHTVIPGSRSSPQLQINLSQFL